MVPVTEGLVTKCLLYSDYDLKTEHSQYRSVSAIIIVKKMVLVGVVFKKKNNIVQEIFSLVLFGLVLYYYFQYPTRKFLSSTEFQESKYKISNSRIPVSFSGLSRDREEDVPESSRQEKIWFR